MKKVSQLISKVTKPIMRKFGFYHSKIITDWPLIVGEKIAQYSIPVKLVINSNKQTGTLYILVNNSSIATELFYQTELILEKIGFYFGHKAVTKLKIQQNPSYAEEIAYDFSKQFDFRNIPQDKRDDLENALDDINDEELRKALFNLGAHVIHAKKSE